MKGKSSHQEFSQSQSDIDETSSEDMGQSFDVAS